MTETVYCQEWLRTAVKSSKKYGTLTFRAQCGYPVVDRVCVNAERHAPKT